MQSVLRCRDCNKPFDKESTLKRHGYYCRSRSVRPERRVRSCVACAKRKIRCGNEKPACTGCVERGVDCVYPKDQSKDTNAKTKQDYRALAGKKTVQHRTNLSVDPPLSSIDSQTTAIDGFGYGILGSDEALAELDFAVPGDGWMNMESDMSFLAGRLTEDEVTPHMSLDLPMACAELSLQSSPQPLSFAIQSSLAIPLQPSSEIRSLTVRPERKPGSRTITALIIQNLRSYPLMMLAHGSLPPFIHPATISPGALSNQVEPLTNCISLMQMISGRTSGNRKLFWRNLRSECERLCNECPTLSDWELLTAMQALSIYLLVRIDEGETEHNNLDVLLTTTITCIARQTASRDAVRSSALVHKTQSLDSRWNAWIVAESSRRLCVIYQIVNMIVYFEPAAMCDLHSSDLVLAPLPAKKQLWDAHDMNIWNNKLAECDFVQALYGLGNDGSLVRLDEDERYHEGAILPQNFLDPRALPRRKAEWSEWCAGMDALGSLIMLAGSLVGY